MATGAQLIQPKDLLIYRGSRGDRTVLVLAARLWRRTAVCVRSRGGFPVVDVFQEEQNVLRQCFCGYSNSSSSTNSSSTHAYVHTSHPATWLTLGGPCQGSNPVDTLWGGCTRLRWQHGVESKPGKVGTLPGLKICSLGGLRTLCKAVTLVWSRLPPPWEYGTPCTIPYSSTSGQGPGRQGERFDLVG